MKDTHKRILVLATTGLALTIAAIAWQAGPRAVEEEVATETDAASYPEELVEIAVTEGHSCAIDRDGAVWCWGLPEGLRQIAFETRARHVATARGIVCATLADESLHCRLLEPAAAIDDDEEPESTPFEPVLVLSQPGERIKQIAAGDHEICALTVAGAVGCWGREALVSGTPDAPVERRIIEGLSLEVSRIAVGAGHSCAVKLDGRAACWGENTDGQLGDGTRTRSPGAVRVAGAFRFRNIAPGATHTCATTVEGEIVCWGWKGGVRMGEPVRIEGVSSASRIAAGASHTCFVGEGRALFCWGVNTRGLLGDGTRIDRATPVPVLGIDTTIRALALSKTHSCLVTNERRAFCWGENETGALGDGTTTDATTPVPVDLAAR